MFVLASPLNSSLSSSLSSAHLSKSSRSMSAPSRSVPSPAAPSLDRSGPASNFADSTAVDNIDAGTTTDMAVTSFTSAPHASSTAASSTAVSSNTAASNAVNSNTAASNPIASNATDRVPAWHAGFLRLLPSIQIHARIAFRRLKKEAREEAVAEVVANALVAYARLVQRGKQDTAFATPLAAFAVRQVWEGRKVGGHIRVRDIMSAYCQRRNGVVIERLDRWDAEEGCWQEVLVEDKTCTPAELAASRIDFVAWLATLSGRDRRIAKLLASGCGTSDVAAKVGLSWARISQMRRELKASWEKFHEPREDEPAESGLSVAA